jgi:hypothetical protein
MTIRERDDYSFGMEPIGRILFVAGLVLLVVGALLAFAPGTPWLGKLPGDIRIDRPGFKLFVPITTSLLLSVVLSVVMYLISRFR